jgi:hypothetical protein
MFPFSFYIPPHSALGRNLNLSLCIYYIRGYLLTLRSTDALGIHAQPQLVAQFVFVLLVVAIFFKRCHPSRAILITAPYIDP